MCWACYTPLGGGTLAAPRSSASSAAVHDDPDKKSIQPWQIGLIGLALLVGVGMGIKTLLPMGADLVDQSTPPIQAPVARAGGPEPVAPVPGGQVAPHTAGPLAPYYLPNLPMPQRNSDAQFQVVYWGNPRVDQTTIAVVSAKPNLTDAEAIMLALYARNKVKSMARFRKLHIYVFRDLEAANEFKSYQVRRSGYPLGESEYRAKAGLWPRTAVVYEFDRESSVAGRVAERVAYPYKAAFNWWSEEWLPLTKSSTSSRL